MKKKQLNGLSLNKKSISNLSSKVGGNNQVTGPTQYVGCVDSNAACVSGLCATGKQCEIDSFLCTNFCSRFNCPPSMGNPLCQHTTIAPLC